MKAQGKSSQINEDIFFNEYSFLKSISDSN